MEYKVIGSLLTDNKFIKYYYEAYDKALSKATDRKKQLKLK